MHLDIILLVVLTALAVWTEVDKLRRRKMRKKRRRFALSAVRLLGRSAISKGSNELSTYQPTLGE